MGIVHAKVPEETTTNIRDFAKQAGLQESHHEPDIKEIDLEKVRARVDKVNIDGLGRTKDDIVEDCIRELFKAKDFQDVLLKAHKVRRDYSAIERT